MINTQMRIIKNKKINKNKMNISNILKNRFGDLLNVHKYFVVPTLQKKRFFRHVHKHVHHRLDAFT